MNSKFFPFTVRGGADFCYNVPRDFASTYHRLRRADVTWYEADVEVLSPTRVTYIVYGMDDPYYGGRGREIYRFTTDIAPEYVLRSLQNRAKELAIYLHDAVEKKKYNDLIARSAAALLKEHCK